MQELVERNKQIYVEKMGLESFEDRRKTKYPTTYKKMAEKYGLSMIRVQQLVGRYKKLYPIKEEE